MGLCVPSVASEPLTGACTSRRISKYCPARKSCASGGRIQPRVGQVPRRWKVCAETAETKLAATAAVGKRRATMMILLQQKRLLRVKQLDGLDEQHFGDLLELFKAPACLSVELQGNQASFTVAATANDPMSGR